MTKEINSRGITPEEMKVAYYGAATLSNRFYITVGPVVRITFAEAHSEEETPIFRMAAALSIQDAIALSKALQDLLKDPEAAIAKEMEEQKKREESKNA